MDFDGGSGGFDDDGFPWNMTDSSAGRPFKNNDFRHPRYADAYGDYRGGYGPGGGYGPPRMRGPRPLMGLLRPPGFGAPMGPPPGPIRGRGFGPNGPPRRNFEEDKAIKYLLRCGLAKENVKNLPREVLMLIHPEHCGLCGMAFDTFILSRMHYISKNHGKNVKKMLTKTHGGSPSEMPIKSRELYCELCDIQITSKTHGEAHYSGKQHRGVVDGRKKPKNPLLLQPHMQWRFEQLLRREKRWLKNSSKEPAPEPEEAPAKPQAVSSDLYCAICKTTVTCSEQMTNHMNGKKHLAKEKHHILMMMKGGAAENENEGGDEDAEKDDGEDWDGNGEGEGATGNDQQDVEFTEEWGENELSGNQEQTSSA